MDIQEYIKYKEQENKIHTYKLKLVDQVTAVEDGESPQVILTISGPELYHPFENGLKIFRTSNLIRNGESISLNDLNSFGAHYNAVSFWCNWASILRNCFKDARYHISAEYIENPENDYTVNSTCFTYNLSRDVLEANGREWPYTALSFVYNFNTFWVSIPAFDDESGNPNGKIQTLDLLNNFKITDVYVDDQRLWCDETEPE